MVLRAEIDAFEGCADEDRAGLELLLEDIQLASETIISLRRKALYDAAVRLLRAAAGEAAT